MRPIFLRRQFSASTSTLLKSSSTNAEIRQSLLDNNVLVVTKGEEKPLASVLISLVAGSRYEAPCHQGVSHFLKHALFKSNKSESTLAISRLQELRGAQISIGHGRDLLMIHAQCPKEHLAETLQSISYMLLPRMLEAHETELIKKDVRFERDLYYSNEKNLLLDQVNYLTWRGAYGNSIVCNEDAESAITNEAIIDHYIRTLLHQGNSVVATGVDHEHLKNLIVSTTKDFQFVKWGDMPALEPLSHSGELQQFNNQQTVKSTLSFPLASGWSNLKDCLTQTIMTKALLPSQHVAYGEKSSVLFRNGLPDGIINIEAGAHMYTGAGLLTFHVHSKEGSSLKKAFTQIKNAPQEVISEEDLQRAKATVLFDLRSAFDSRSSFEHLTAEQIAANGKPYDWKQIETTVHSIDLVQVRKITEEVFSKKPSLASIGYRRGIPYLDEL